MPSRLIVKNLPKYMTLERFRLHFESQGQITDAHLVKTKDGIFRRFGYIGYKNESEAMHALEYFNNSFIDTCRISVEIAKSIKDPSLSRPWSRYSEGSSAYDKKNPSTSNASNSREKKTCAPSNYEIQKEMDNAKKEELLKYLYADESDDKLKEFLAVMRPRKSGNANTWANDDVLVAQSSRQDAKKLSKLSKRQLLQKEEEQELDDQGDDDEYQDLSLVIENSKSNQSVSDGNILDEISTDEIAKEEENEEEEEEEMEKSKDSIAFDSTISDLDYLKSKMMKPKQPSVTNSAIHPSRMQIMQDVLDSNEEKDVVDFLSKESYNPTIQDDLPIESPITSTLNIAKDLKVDIQEGEGEKEEEEETENQENGQGHVQLIGETGRLFVKNLPYNIEQEELESLFSKFGPLTEVHIPIYKDTKLQKGFAFVQFMLPEHAVNAFADLDGTIFQGRIMEIIPGKEKLKNKETETVDSKSFKSKKDSELKKYAGNDYNWNSLFMNSDAVAEAMAKKLGVKKNEILNHENSNNMAVRLALAETNIITDTKEYLKEQGVSLDSFNKSRKDGKSQTVVLVKNLPASAFEEDIIALFEKFGTLGRVLVPPSNTMALVEFLESNEAKAAFTSLAYTKYKSVPLFLEWAPKNVFVSAFDPSQNSKKDAQKSLTSHIEKEQEEQDESSAIGSSLFVKNLNFSTTESLLESTFSVCPGLRSVRIPTKMDKNGNKLSLGYGFLEFESKEQALNCIKTMQNTKLEGHELSLKMSNAGSTNNSQKKTKRSLDQTENIKKSTKMIIRNIPFEATKKDIQQLFSSFGMVKSVRLPSKFDGTHRGFGFVDFLTKQEALNAYESLGATHLYGRHLVLEWAAQEDEEDGMRKITRVE